MQYTEATVRRRSAMQIPEIIKTSLDYIEQNLRTDITAEELARMANYSTFHYYRLFSSVMDSSVTGYIKKRRLDHALSEIAGGRRTIDVVLEYGFDTYAGFYKAFIKMYGCSPKKYIAIYSKHKPKKPEVANSIIYTEKELRKILGNWEIDKQLPICDIYIMHGTKPSGNDWTVGNDFVLRTGSRDLLMKDLKISKALAKQGFVSSLPVPTKTGSIYLDGEALFVLSQALKGSPLPDDDRFGDERTEFGVKYGRSLARLHKALKEVQDEVCPDEVNLYRTVADWALPNVRQLNLQWNMGLDEAFFTDYLESFGTLYDALPKQLIHRNPHPGNILFLDGEVSGFINFDLSELNIRLFDVCYCSTGILSETSDEMYEKWLDVLSGILHGYDSESNLAPEEKQAIYDVICSISMIFAAYLDSREEFGPLGKTTTKILEFVVKNREQIKNIF